MTLNANYVDLLIILVLLYFATEAFRHDFWTLLVDFLSFFGSLAASLRIYKFTSTFLSTNFSLDRSLSNALGFLLTAIIIEAVLSYLLVYLASKLPKEVLKNKLSKLLGIIPGIGEGLILIAFFLTLVLALPLAPKLKRDVSDSVVGSYLLRETTVAERYINEVFGGVIEDSLTYLTIKPQSRESIPLTVEKGELTVDETSESQLFALVNKERKERGIHELIWRPEIVPVARAHAKDMWERRYFSHYSPEGLDVGDRLETKNVDYRLAGENLALAPTLSVAHNGLMNSEGHRANILEPTFKRIGIGIIDNGVYGKMFVQIFTD